MSPAGDIEKKTQARVVVAHELAHLIERHHDRRFTALLDRNLPNWRLSRQELNAAPLGHAEWTY